jgi:hypothetical protein
MQLQFTPDEFQVLADIFEERDDELRAEIAATGESTAKAALEKDRQLLNDLENRIIDRDLEFTPNELDAVIDVAARHERALLNMRAELTVPQRARLALLKHIRERLAETCAMF